MRLLLDSHIAFWWMVEPERLTADEESAIADPANDAFLSAVCVWELGLKAAKGKLRLASGFEDEGVERGLEPLGMTLSHAAESTRLPPLHGDPFDRALVAQCRLESMTLMSRDPWMREYGIAVF